MRPMKKQGRKVTTKFGAFILVANSLSGVSLVKVNLSTYVQDIVRAIFVQDSRTHTQTHEHSENNTITHHVGDGIKTLS